MGGERLEEKTKKNNDLKPLYVRSVVNSFGSGAVSPFLGVYAVKLDASPSQMGWFQSVSNLSPNLMQVFWGKLSDKIGRRVPFILIGGLITTVLWLPLMYVASATQLIGVIAVQSLLGSMATPAWNALIGDLIHSSRRGRATAMLNLTVTIGSLMATLLAGYLMTIESGSLHQMFFVPFLIAIFCGAVSSLSMLFVHEKPQLSRVSGGSGGSPFGLRDVTGKVRSNPNFMRFCTASVVFAFFMSMSWPLFSITLITVLNASMLEVALLSVINGAVKIVLQPWGGKLVDRVGRRQLILIYHSSLILVPIFYGLAPNIFYLYILNIILGGLSAFGDVAIFAYLLDATPEEDRGTLTAFYNMTSGGTVFIGSLIGGYLANYFLGVFALIPALLFVYMLSAMGRGIGASTFTFLKEPYKYPSTLKRELWETVQKILPLPE